jgi:RND family efflux transporter MFP subunit
MKRLIVILLAAVVPAGCHKREEAAALLPPLVRAFDVAPSAQAQLALRGSVVAEQRVKLGFKQGGVIAALLVRAGDHVASGQVVGRMDDIDARSAVRMAQAARDKAQRDAERTERLLTGGAIPQSVRDDARNQLEAAEAQLGQAREAVERTQLRSPVTGTVFARLSEPGETVGSGNPVLVIDSSGELLVRAGATERERAQLRMGLTAVLETEGSATCSGRVTSIATTPNTDDGLYTVEVLPERAQGLLPGGLVMLRLSTPKGAGLLRIPLEALVHRDDKDHVFVLTHASTNVTARMRPITVDRVEGTTLVVREGLKDGERIVAEGAYFLQDGQSVRILEQAR